MTLKQALRYLMKSRTRLTRKRGRRAVRSALNAILKQYPSLNKDNQENKKPTPCVCPICGVPARTWLILAAHLRRKHRCTQGMPTVQTGKSQTCPGCGCLFTLRGLAAHLAALSRKGALAAHCVPAAAANLFGRKS